MKENDIEDRLKQLKIEDIIWIIYIGIIILSWYSNNLEKDFFITNNKTSKETYRKIIIFIFIILNIVYTYYLTEAIKGVKSNSYESIKVKNLNNLSLIASTLISISGIIILYIAIEDKDMNVEIAFN